MLKSVGISGDGCFSFLDLRYIGCLHDNKTICQPSGIAALMVRGQFAKCCFVCSSWK